MITKVEVMPEKEYEAWYRGEAGAAGKSARTGIHAAGKKTSVHPEGSTLVQEKGCLACHSTDGTPKIGPTLKGILGRNETVVTAGKERGLTVDEGYLRQSYGAPGRYREGFRRSCRRKGLLRNMGRCSSVFEKPE
jgi:cytochrome c oxidase subunit 2